MITLVSYPRSGNTFMRNVLFECYGIASKTFHHEAHGPDPGWSEEAIVKTHLLPHQLPDELSNRPVVYLIRDGRDAIVSLAHHRSDVIDRTSSYVQNLEEAIYASEGSHFGGWSHHVESWLPKASIIVRFEDLIKDPIGQIERLRQLMDLPDPVKSRLPSFDDLKMGQPEYGSGKHLSGENLARSWFRKGKVNGWMKELDDKHHTLFWHLHGEAMEQVGYVLDGSRILEPEVSFQRASILIEADKLNEQHIDGIGRYVRSLLETASRFPIPGVGVNALVSGNVLPLTDVLNQTEARVAIANSGLYYFLKDLLRALIPSSWFNSLARNYQSRLMAKSFEASSDTVSDDPRLPRVDALLVTLPQHALNVASAQYDRLVGVIHDLTHIRFPSLHEESNISRAEKGLAFLKQRADDLIAVSSATQKDCQEIGLATKLIYEGVDRRRFYPVHNDHLLSLIRERYVLPKTNYLLSLSTLEPRKNLKNLIDAYSKLPISICEEFHLVIAGRRGWKWDDVTLSKEIMNQVHFTGYIREDHLPALYTRASAFCLVSSYEGFGLPVLEAMACGTQVLVSNRGALPELVGDVGVICDPDDQESIVRGLKDVIERSREVDGAEVLMKQTWKFNWRSTWLQTVQILLQNKTT